MISQVFISLVNPGIPSKSHLVSDEMIELFFQQKKLEDPKNNKLKICKICNVVVEKIHNVKHCEICNICTYGNFNLFNFRYATSLQMVRKMHCKEK